MNCPSVMVHCMRQLSCSMVPGYVRSSIILEFSMRVLLDEVNSYISRFRVKQIALNKCGWDSFNKLKASVE